MNSLHDELKDDENLLWSQLRKFVTLIDELRDVGLQEYIELPRIATCGTQSAGKSSLLEYIMGLDCLPRGDGVVTRRPLELRLVHTSEKTIPKAVFDEIPGKEFTNFSEVKKSINELTDKIAGTNKNIVNKPIVLKVFSHSCPDLTIIDLPGITRIPLAGSDQPKDIELVTTNMIRAYCQKTRTIILAVIPANQDLAVSEALKLAQELDPHGIRTIGAITKIDIMDKGTDAKRVLQNQEIPLRLGYVGIKNRSQQDIINNMPVKEALKIEKEFFQKHPIYSVLPKDCLGAESLTSKLSRIMYVHIRYNLPSIIKEVEEKFKEVKEKLELIGTAPPQNTNEKMQLIWTYITNTCTSFRSTISGKFDNTRKSKTITSELSGGAKIKMKFYKLIEKYSYENFNASSDYTDKEVIRAIELHEGDNLPGFPSPEIFSYLAKPQIEKLKEHVLYCLQEVYDDMDALASSLVNTHFTRFPQVGEIVLENISEILQEEREKTKDILTAFMDSQTDYMFTNDTEYVSTMSDLIAKKEEESKKVDPKSAFANEIKSRLNLYFRIVVRNIRDVAPKIIGYYMVKTVMEKLQFNLFSRVGNKEQIHMLLSEPSHIAEERKRLNQTYDTLRNALKVLTKDPDLTSSLSSIDDELLTEIKKHQENVY